MSFTAISAASRAAITSIVSSSGSGGTYTIGTSVGASLGAIVVGSPVGKADGEGVASSGRMGA